MLKEKVNKEHIGQDTDTLNLSCDSNGSIWTL